MYGVFSIVYPNIRILKNDERNGDGIHFGTFFFSSSEGAKISVTFDINGTISDVILTKLSDREDDENEGEVVSVISFQEIFFCSFLFLDFVTVFISISEDFIFSGVMKVYFSILFFTVKIILTYYEAALGEGSFISDAIFKDL